MFNIPYITSQETLKTRDIYRILQKQKKSLVALLESLGSKSVKEPNVTSQWETQTTPMIAEYLYTALPVVMVQASLPTIHQYKEQLPKGYKIGFDLPTDPAKKYLDNLKRLHLSNYKGSISATTNDEVKNIIAQWVGDGLSYGEIAKQIREIDPFIFSKARANLIAITEVGRAYGFAHYIPTQTMTEMWFVLEKQWITSHDARVRPTHQANESLDWIPLAQNFPNGDEYAPSVIDIRCRCHHVTRIIE